MFTDKKKRKFVQYKGWCIDDNGEPIKDPLMELKGPTLQRYIDYYAFNLIDKKGHKILSKSVSWLEYVVSYDLYIVSDFFKDDLSDKNAIAVGKNTEGVPRGRGLAAPESVCLLSISFR